MNSPGLCVVWYTVVVDNIKFPATVYKVGTLADGGVRVSLDLPEGLIVQSGALIKCLQDGIALHIEATPIPKEPSVEDVAP